jgi:hypothetical protein
MPTDPSRLTGRGRLVRRERPVGRERLVQRCQDPRGQVRGAAVIHELEQFVQVHALAVSQHLGETGSKSGAA